MGLLGWLLGGDRSTRVGLFVDGPNVLRSEFDVDLDDLRDVAREEVQSYLESDEGKDHINRQVDKRIDEKLGSMSLDLNFA